MGQMGENRPLNGMGQERYESQVGTDRAWKTFEQAVMKRAGAQRSSDKDWKNFQKKKTPQKTKKKKKKVEKKSSIYS